MFLKQNIFSITLIVLVSGLALTGCVSIPQGVTVIQNFQQEKYLGTWYEVARLDHRFERNLNQVSATYSLNSNGTIKVINKGFDSQKQQWKQVEGVAKFVNAPTEGSLKVSFFRPFYGGYHIIALDDAYQNVLVAGNNKNYLWLMSRQKEMPNEIKIQYLQKAQSLGFDTTQLIWLGSKPN